MAGGGVGIGEAAPYRRVSREEMHQSLVTLWQTRRRLCHSLVVETDKLINRKGQLTTLD